LELSLESVWLWFDGEEAIKCRFIAIKRFNPRDPMSSIVLGHRDKENDTKIEHFANALQMNPHKPSDVVDPSHPILPFEDIDRVFYEPEKGGQVRNNSLNALKDT
jgi:hypothetical protein